MNNWWSDEDREVFKRLSDEVVDYYSSFEVIEGKHINGEKTVNENIADLGALACIVEIAKDNDASHDEFKKMFEAFASVWASRESEEYMELLLLQDVHAPNEFRVNAVLSSIEEFYQVYYIYPLNDMWISKNDRVMVWQIDWSIIYKINNRGVHFERGAFCFVVIFEWLVEIR